MHEAISSTTVEMKIFHHYVTRLLFNIAMLIRIPFFCNVALLKVNCVAYSISSVAGSRERTQGVLRELDFMT